MKIQEALDAYYSATGTVSTITRQLSLSGIAIIWIFCVVENGTVTIPMQLKIPALAIIISLIFDLLQYVVKATSWGIFKDIMYNQHKDFEKDVDEPKGVKSAILFFFVGKIVAMIVAYWNIFFFILETAKFT